MSRAEPVDVLAVIEGAGNFLIAKGAVPADVVALHEARAAIAELIEVLNMVNKIWSSDQTANIAPDSPKAKVRAALARVGSAGGAP